ncbi:hypothetical protein FB45DRAFT_798371 [Roridomyces roridus]|uniref:DUF7779 domain-containing protein n=1 Tax=Roridomyces roridus TaxID=1738132 RepID=A0AAD7FIR0_9AGAR|nr:hypothetical protein FB45DRAFT_798371 [Roridomyces roridus]
MSSTAEPSTAGPQMGTHVHVHGGTGGPGGAGGQHGGQGGSGEGGTLIHGNQIATLNVYSHGQEQRQQSQIEPISQEQCHTALALVRCPPASQIFQGRQEILDKMQQYFAQDNKKRRVYVLHGLGGSGKTQIALKFLEETSDEFARQFFVNASSSEALNTSFMNIAISQGFGQTAEAGFQWLIAEHKKWTLLFDNADDPKLKLWPFFPQCTHGNIIITSRNPQLAAYSPDAHCQVGDLDEDNAVRLLLARAVQEDTDETRKLAMTIELSCLPLAIVHAGAYIAKFKGLVKYLSIYRKNKEELLRRHPDHAHDNYEWTVYTTWQISYERLSPVAARFLQLCALLHHSKIPESIFCKATEWIVNNEGSEPGSMQEAKEFLQNFVSSSGSWHDQHFRDTVAEIEEYSLLQRDEASNTLSMHPLVHLWCSGTLPYQGKARGCMSDILGMAIDLDPGAYLMRIELIDHVKMLVQDDLTLINSQFWNQFGQIYHDGGQFRQARRINELWVEQCQKLLGDDHPDTLNAMADLAATYWQLGQYQEAEPLEISVLERRQKLLGDDHPDTLRAMANLAGTYSELGRYQEAESLDISVLARRQKLLGDDHPDTLRAMANLAATYRQLGRSQEAELLEISVLEWHQKVLGDNHPDTLKAMANLAATYRELGQYREAEPLQISVLERSQKLLSDEHPDTLRAMANLAATYSELGRYQEAEPLQSSVLERSQKLLGDDHPDTLRAMGNLAATYARLERYQEAEPLESFVLARRQKLLGDHHPGTLIAMGNLAMTLHRTGRHQAAENLQLKVVTKCTEVLGADHPHTHQATKALKATQDALVKARDPEHTSVKGLSKLFSRFKLSSSKK